VFKIRQLTDVLHCKLQHHFHAINIDHGAVGTELPVTAQSG